MGRSVAELRDFADKHLWYEILMTGSLAARMKRHAVLFDNGLSSDDGRLADEVLEMPGRNADIESFAIHARNLWAFLYLKKPQGGDVVAANYFDDRDEWFKVRGPRDKKSLGRINSRVPVEIGHISLGRQKEYDRQWEYEAIWRDLANVMDVFLKNVPGDRVSAAFRKDVKALISRSITTEANDLLAEMRRMSLAATAGATEMFPGYTVSDSDGTVTLIPKPEPPGFGD
jgi:hypothetical protein